MCPHFGVRFLVCRARNLNFPSEIGRMYFLLLFVNGPLIFYILYQPQKNSKAVWAFKYFKFYSNFRHFESFGSEPEVIRNNGYKYTVCCILLNSSSSWNHFRNRTLYSGDVILGRLNSDFVISYFLFSL